MLACHIWTGIPSTRRASGEIGPSALSHLSLAFPPLFSSVSAWLDDFGTNTFVMYIHTVFPNVYTLPNLTRQLYTMQRYDRLTSNH